jgi:hypothetical protein
MAILRQEYTRFRISTPPFAVSTYSANNTWAIDKGMRKYLVEEI